MTAGGIWSLSALVCRPWPLLLPRIFFTFSTAMHAINLYKLELPGPTFAAALGYPSPRLLVGFGGPFKATLLTHSGPFGSIRVTV